MKNESKIKKWEAALLIALSITLCHGVRLCAQQEKLTENVVRLHVIAESDGEEEQALKLRVRDSVLECLAPLTHSAQSIDNAQRVIEENLENIEKAALSASEGREVRVEFSLMAYPRRCAGSFTLPAGEYNSLRVIIGKGEGQNWWGIIFPYLVSDSVEEVSEAVKILGGNTFALISEDGMETQYKFRIFEILDALRAKFE